MSELLNNIQIVLLPLVITSCLHMIVVKKNYLSNLKIAIWPKGFGDNKTWRGVFFVPLTNAIILFLSTTVFNLKVMNPFFLGYSLGLSYLLFELPNSFLKRRIGIKAGETHLQNRYFFYILDKTDSSFGVTFIYFLLTDMSLKSAIELFITNSIVHMVIAILLIKLKIKSSF